MKSFYLSCITWLIITVPFLEANSQEAAAYLVDEDHNLYQTSKDSLALVFVNMAYIRSEPTSKSELLDSIPLGTEVKFIDETALNPTSLRGMYLPWHKVEYQRDKKKHTGYIWLGLLSLDNSTDKNSKLTFMYGFSWKSNEENDNYYWVEAKVLDKNLQLLKLKSFPYYPGGQSYTNGEILNNTGLPYAKLIYSIMFHGEACGIASEDNFLAWDGNDFTTLPKTSSVSDAGVFYYNEELVYPKDHQKGNDIILKLSEEGEVENFDEVKPGEDLKYKISKKEETYQRNGNIYQKVAERTLN